MREDYVDLKYKPNENEIICCYKIKPAKGISIEKAANHLAGESSIDTWSDILTLSPNIAKRLKPHVFYIDKKKCKIKIAYNCELFEKNSIPQILSSIAGNIFGMKILESLRLEDISFPKSILKNFKGPKFGLKGIRKLFKVDRPLIGTIVKPKVGLTSKQHAKVAYEAWIGGCDIVKDDENLTNQKFNRFEKRLELTFKLKERAEKETGEKKVYMCNITAPSCKEMLRRAKLVKDIGNEYVMIDIIPTGFTALQTLREENEELNIIIHAHRCMHAALTRNENHGISMLVIAKLIRMIGLDQLHIGTVLGKMHGDKEEVLSIRDECVSQKTEANENLNILGQDWFNIKPIFPVASGGLDPTMIPELVKIFGNDIILQFGGGIHAHPLGTEAGAKACRQALEAVRKNISLEDAAEKYKELREAMRKWGKYFTP